MIREGSKREYRIPWIPIIGVFLAVIEALFAIRILLQEPIYAVILALLIVVLTLQIDQIARTQEAVERTRDDAVFWQRFEQSPWMRGLIEEIVDSAASIDAMPDNEIFIRCAKPELQECHYKMMELARGRIRINPDRFHQVIIPMARKTRERIRGMAVRNPQSAFEWWDTPTGKEYWNVT